MCGLIVTASFDGAPADPALLLKASEVLSHRGPDDFGTATYGPVGLGFRRLSILDLSPAGHQPMELQDGRFAIVFNGEIYNYVELGDELRRLGRSFRSTSDTEVLLHAYDQWGEDCVSRFNGMWAFVIFDKRRQCLFASRDRFGVKPLYFWRDARRLVLASEIKAIVATGWYQPEVNWQTAAQLLCRNYLDHDASTFYAGVEQLPAGSSATIRLDGEMRVTRYWSLAQAVIEPPPDPIARFHDLFVDAVRLRMRSDVPVGVCLSGGIDSNAIISTMADQRSGAADPLQAFSYIPDEFSEAPYIQESLARTGATLNRLDTNPKELWDILPTALWHYDEPVHSPTALIGFQLMRLAKSRGVTVVLNGQGADEVNAGYHAFFRDYWTDLFRQLRVRRAIAEMIDYSRAQPRIPWRLLAKTVGHLVRSTSQVSSLYSHAQVYSRAQGPRTRDWYHRELTGTLPPPGEIAAPRSLAQALTASVERWPLPLYLRVEDRNSMAHSVEARLPFLDYRLVSLAFSLPSEWKLRGRWNKFIVREAMKGVIAEPVRTRIDKMGFPTPSRQWFAGPWYEATKDLLASRRLRESGICRVDVVTSDLERHRAGKVDISRRLFHLAQVGLWLENATSRAQRIVA